MTNWQFYKVETLADLVFSSSNAAKIYWFKKIKNNNFCYPKQLYQRKGKNCKTSVGCFFAWERETEKTLKKVYTQKLNPAFEFKVFFFFCHQYYMEKTIVASPESSQLCSLDSKRLHKFFFFFSNQQLHKDLELGFINQSKRTKIFI